MADYSTEWYFNNTENHDVFNKIDWLIDWFFLNKWMNK